ncbi:MAG: hypothetical protein R2776_04505 [Flavobacteriaceae bacterium]|nr:hypothetical protein [Flavobacteriaceae bacterium]
MKKLIIFTLISLSTYNLYSQNKTIKGRVIAEDFEILPGVSIITNDTIVVGKTDLNGFFQIDIHASEKKILFFSIGLEQTTIELLDKCDNVEVVMMLDFTYDFITLKTINRKRKKRFKKLPNIYKQAFLRNLFESEYPCYTQELKLYYLDEN